VTVSGAGMGAASVVATVVSLVVAVGFVSVEAATAVVSFTVVVCRVVSMTLVVVAVVTAALIVVFVMDEVDDVEALQLVMPPMDNDAIKRTRIKADF